jgi:hypothetical protein
MNKLMVAVAAAVLVVAGRAGATTCTTTISIPSGDGSEPFATLNHPGVCVQAEDKLFSNFEFGDLPIATGNVTFALETVLGTEYHDITFTDQFAVGHKYTGFGYTVTATAPDITALLADFTQTTGGPTALTEMTIPSGSGSIDLNKTKQFLTTSSTTEIDYTPSALSLVVSETLSVGSKSNVSAIEDTIVQDVPEPSSLAVLVASILAVPFVRRRRQNPQTIV